MTTITLVIIIDNIGACASMPSNINSNYNGNNNNINREIYICLIFIEINNNTQHINIVKILQMLAAIQIMNLQLFGCVMICGLVFCFCLQNIVMQYIENIVMK